jgi:hypothetical protein
MKVTFTSVMVTAADLTENYECWKRVLVSKIIMKLELDARVVIRRDVIDIKLIYVQIAIFY